MSNFTAALNYWVLGGFEGKKDVFTAIDETAAMGLSGLELTFGEVIAENISQEACIEIKTYAKRKGIALKTMASGFYWGTSLASENPAERARAIEFTRKYITAASYLGVESVLIIPGAVDVAWDPSRPVIPYDKVYEFASASLKQLIPLAEELKVHIALENVWNKFLLSPLEFRAFIDQFQSEAIGIYLDVGNTLLQGYPEHWINILGHRIKAVHVKNFSREDAGGVLHGFGDSLLVGDVNFPAVFAALEKIGYTGPITAEMIPFCRLPDLVLPDMELARKTAIELLSLL